MNIRKAGIADAIVITEFNTALAWETEELTLPQQTVEAGVESLCKHPENGFYIVAESQYGVVASMMITYEWSDWRNGMIWWLQSVYVLPKHRRQGAFRAMYEFVTQLASADENVRGLRLYVEQHNENAQQTYRDLGMKESHYRMFEQMKPF